MDAFLSLTAVAGGLALVARPDGSLLGMPVDIMHGTFASFLIPGLLLTGLGVLAGVAAVLIARRSKRAATISAIAGAGFVVWIDVEIAILLTIHWAHVVIGLLGAIAFWLSMANGFGARAKPSDEE